MLKKLSKRYLLIIFTKDIFLNTLLINEQIIGADGKKYNVKKKIYKDANGNQVEEVKFRINEFLFTFLLFCCNTGRDN